jgi:prepilin-type N-terminal cleavage/methylation domain-containing protein
MISPRSSPFSPLAPSIHCRRRAFTLVELLVVIGIITVLIGITIPVVSKIRENAQAAASQAVIAQLMGACETYRQDFGAFPGPIPNYAIYAKGIGLTLTGTADEIKLYNKTTNTESNMVDQPKITMAENMVLGLLGGLFRNTTGNICYDPTLVGSGPRTLGRVVANIKTRSPYLASTNLFKANGGALNYHDDAGAADDSEIPEFIDAFTNQMPILYLRAVNGRTTTSTPNNWNASNNPVITYNVDPRVNDPNGTGVVGGPYDVSQILSYTGSTGMSAEQNSPTPPPGNTSIGVGKKLSRYYIAVNSPSGTYTPSGALMNGLPYHGLRTVDPNSVSTLAAAGSSVNNGAGTGVYSLPMDAYAYFSDPNNRKTPRQQNGYILISAGKDRVYGTEDDLTNFGLVNP